MNKIVIALFLVLALVGCAGSQKVPNGSQQATVQPRHFDFNQAVAAINAGKAKIGKGDLDGAISDLETGLTLWPAHQPAWAALSHAYELKGDVSGANYAGYFAERIEWANSLHGYTAASAFDNIALINDEKPFADLRIPQTAILLSAFYRQGEARIRAVENLDFGAQKTFGQRYLLYPVAIVTGGILVYKLVKAGGSN